jgi:hypothetical protein
MLAGEIAAIRQVPGNDVRASEGIAHRERAGHRGSRAEGAVVQKVLVVLVLIEPRV